jgi:trimeric autotransporter adhesin
MLSFSSRLAILGAGVAVTSVMLPMASGAVQNRQPVGYPGSPALRVAAQSRVSQSNHEARRGRSIVYPIAPSPCPTDYGTAGAYFVGVNASNVAGGNDSAVLGGFNNGACDPGSAIGGGESNVVGNNGYATDSFLAAGKDNAVAESFAFVGSGFGNEAAANDSFVGSGQYGVAQGAGSFVGAGGIAYGMLSSAGPGGGNVAGAQDSFVGTGDANQIASTGEGSFIGGGGYYEAAVIQLATGGNKINGYDSFIGAGDANSAYVEDAIGGGLGNKADGVTAFVGAGVGNTVSGNGSVIGAGGSNGAGNTVSGADSFVGAGDNNNVASLDTFVGSGYSNIVGSSASYASILGGERNSVTAEFASILGGYGNTASGSYAIVAGGNSNTAAGTLTYAAGYHADAKNPGSFVWSDYKSGSATISDTGSNQFIARASGGVYLYSNEGATSGVSLAPGSGAWASLSDRNAKTDIVPLDDASVLAKVAALPVSTWRYKTETGVRHAGPMAQDFYAAFGVGEDNRHITSIDEDGIALASIKALYHANRRLTAENGQLLRQVSALKEAFGAQNRQLRGELAALETKVDAMTEPAGKRQNRFLP